jgi:NAD(P)-dependent dehydrogenase (short-subunit alcohol dehydrogenase family)
MRTADRSSLASSVDPHAPVTLVTGANAGIGRAIAMGLANHGCRVVLACRSRARALEAAAEIEEQTRMRPEILIVDLADRGSVLDASAEALARFPHIDILVLNAAVWSVTRRLAPSAHERTWATNVLGHHLLLRLLEERLVRSRPARVVVVASGLAHSLDLDDTSFEARPYRGIDAYAQSKQAARMLTRAYSRRLAPRGVTVSSMHPGFTRTDAFARGGGVQGFVAGLGARLFGKRAVLAADTALWLATSDEVTGLSGGYFQDRNEMPCAFTDAAGEEALFSLCDAQSDVASARAALDPMASVKEAA